MARHYTAYGRGAWNLYESSEFSTAALAGIDVFVSHQSGDKDLAADVAAAVQANGLSVWLDLIDPNVSGDGPDLANYIERVLTKSKALLAVVTTNTQRSWWVPFEIGIAFELSKYLASFGDKRLNPSFLANWPNVPDSPTGKPAANTYLQTWCRRIRALSRAPTHATYLTEMRAMAITY